MTKQQTHRLEENLLLLFIFLLALAFYLGYTVQLKICHDSSVYCQIKRASLIGLQWSLFLGARYGITSKTYALALLFSLAGAAASLSQARLFVCMNEGMAQKQVWGFSPYSWSLLLFAASIAITACLLVIHKPKGRPEVCKMRFSQKTAFLLICSTSLLAIYSLIQM